MISHISKSVFKETQKFDQWWIWALLTLSLAPNFIIIGEALENNSLNLTRDLFVLNSILGGVILLFWIMKLKTQIDKLGIKFTYVPFYKRAIAWSEITSLQLIKYGFVGYGIRFFTGHGTIFNTKGNKGLAITLKNGKRLVIGTQKPEEIERFIENQKLGLKILPPNFHKKLSKK